jgi:hypothetical protein
MATATARRHVENALRARLGIRSADAHDVVTSWENVHAIHAIKRDMRDCVAIAVANDPWVAIYARAEDGLYDIVLTVRVDEALFARWKAMPLEQAYRLPDGVAIRWYELENEAQRIEQAVADAEDEAIAPHFGPAPDPRDHVWVDGVITDVRILDDRTLVVDAVVDDVAGRYVKFPVFGTVEEVAAYMREKIDLPARLCLEDQRFDPVPGFEDCRIIEMVVPNRGRHRLRMAA